MFSYLKEYFKLYKMSTVENISRVPSDNICENNRIEEDLQLILRPLNFMQGLFFCAKYSIRGKSITCTTRGYHLLRVICVIVAHGYNAYLFIVNSIAFWNNPIASSFFYSSLCLWVSSFIAYILYMIGDSLNSIVNISMSHLNIVLVLKIQHVLSFLRLRRSDVKGSIICSWACVIIANILSFGWIAYFCATAPEINYIPIITSYASITYEINVIYAFTLLNLTTKMLNVCINEFRTSSCLKASENVKYLHELFHTYCNILEIYMIIEKTFQHMVSI
ncbi:hypothetical protein B5X24_HaOG200745 [Helicoverpa armigera]|uniref:Gustatory receptor n=1 Tax=Helicoverpa armigera TaxID=29058 RepID=A0A2W1BTW3_HELAM|nr:hypothetical protein B5X24_HaOG200745 [Helicoverpa armigera]